MQQRRPRQEEEEEEEEGSSIKDLKRQANSLSRGTVQASRTCQQA